MFPIQEFFELHRLALEKVSQYPRHRFLFDRVTISTGKHFLGVVGPRGVGKSILLRQWCAQLSKALYLSVDAFSDLPLFEVVKCISQDYGITHFFLDEVHFLPHIDAELKKIYDFLDVSIVFTSSVALGMYRSQQDLSRRVRIIELPPFSFHEFLYFKTGKRLSALTLQDIFQKNWQMDHLAQLSYFDSFLKGGNMPFALEEDTPLPLLANILHTIIHKDIPRLHPLTTDELSLIEKMVQFIGKSTAEGISYSSLSKNLGITKYKAEQYVDLLCHSFVLHRLLPKGTTVTKEPKILMHLPYRLLYRSFEEAIGGLREDFAVSTLLENGISLHYLKSKTGAKTPDFLLRYNEETVVIEVGGKNKGLSQFKDVEYDKKLIFSHTNHSDEIRRPLFILGYLKAG